MTEDSLPLKPNPIDDHGLSDVHLTYDSSEIISPYRTSEATVSYSSVPKPQQDNIFTAMKIISNVTEKKEASDSKSILNRCRPKCCSLSHYQQHFEVSTEEVLERAKRALIPVCFTKPFYMPKSIEKPDLYGPFWICTTCIILLTAASNFTEWMHFKPTTEHPVWRANFATVTTSTCLLYSEITIIPLIIWMSMARIGIKKEFVEIMSLYGYSLVIFIPNVFLCAIPLESIQWISSILTFLVSASFLLRNICNGVMGPSDDKPASMMELAKIVRKEDGSWNLDGSSHGFDEVGDGENTTQKMNTSDGKFRLVLLAMLLLQTAFCLSIKLYFFY